MLDPSQKKWNWWNMKTVQCENYTISKIYERVDLQRSLSPGVTSMNSGPSLLGLNPRYAIYCIGDLEKYLELYDFPLPHP